MIRLDDVRTRIEGAVPELAGRLGNAGDFANLVETSQLPQVTPAGYVLPGGIQGSEPDVTSGLFRQSFREVVSVILVSRVAGDPLSSKAIDELAPFVRTVVAAVCGWGPADAIGVFQLVQAELVGAKGGALIFQIDFALNDQLRITT
jgi:hypothetical protein